MKESISKTNIIKVEPGNNDEDEIHPDEMEHISSNPLNAIEQGHLRKVEEILDLETPNLDSAKPGVREKVVVICTEIEIEYPQAEKICLEFPEDNFESIQNEVNVNDPVTMANNSEAESPKNIFHEDNIDSEHHQMESLGYIYTGRTSTDKNAEQNKPPPAQKIYACPECSFTCSQRGHLNVHRRTHTGEKPFSCLECGFRFLRKGALNNHMTTHSGLKPFSCSECEYVCSRKGDLKLHSRTHSGEKPFSCTECNYKCSQKGTIKNHILTHTGEKPFACSKCEYICSEKGSLRRHSRIHTK